MIVFDPKKLDTSTRSKLMSDVWSLLSALKPTMHIARLGFSVDCANHFEVPSVSGENGACITPMCTFVVGVESAAKAAGGRDWLLIIERRGDLFGGTALRRKMIWAIT